MQSVKLRLMTYNIGGARKDFGSVEEDVINVIRDASPDILALQEATEFEDADNAWHRDVDQIAQAAQSYQHTGFGSTVSMQEHLHVCKDLFVYGIFKDWQDWRQGNALLSRFPFVRLGDTSKSGVPKNVPLHLPQLYQGNRDTEPRHALLARVDKSPIFPFAVGVHFTALVAEREREEGPRPLPGRLEEAQILRFRQAKRLLDLLRRHVLERGKVIFLMGDFNALASEPCIASVLVEEGQFVRLAPSEAQASTHLKMVEPIDHILIYPRSKLVEYECHVIVSPAAKRASDHYPVVADVEIRY